MRADKFYPFFGLFWPFWFILCTLVHFGENRVILVGPLQTAVAAIMTPKGLGYAHMGPYFDSWQLGGHKYALAGVSAGPIRARVPSIPHLSAPGACPQNVHVFTKMNQGAQNTLK